MKLKVFNFAIIFLLSIVLWVVGPQPLFAQQTLYPSHFVVGNPYSNFDLSPDGRKVVITDNSLRQTRVLIKSVDPNTADRFLDINDARPLAAQWATNERLIVPVMTVTDMKLPKGIYAVHDNKRDKYLRNIVTARMPAIDEDGSNPVMMFEKTSKALQLNINLAQLVSPLIKDPDHIIMSAFDKTLGVYKVNIQTGKAKRLSAGRSDTRAWHVNPDGIPNMRIDARDDFRKARVYARLDGTKRWKKIKTIEHQDIRGIIPLPAMDDPNAFYIAARPDGQDRTGIYHYYPDNGRFGDPVFTHPNYDLDSPVFSASGDYMGARYIENRKIYDSQNDVHTQAMARLRLELRDDISVDILDTSDDMSVWLISLSGPTEPGRVAIFNIKTAALTTIHIINSKLKPKDLTVPKPVNFTARDGTPLSGYLTRKNGVAASAPLIVMPHGGPESRDYWSYDLIAQYFVSQGYQIFQPNFRGSSGFGEAFVKAGHREWGGLMQDDITDGVQHLIATGQANQGNICIAGSSYGGYAALMGAVKTPALYNCAVAINAPSDFGRYD
ncbi:alpha/beta hydrolase family protein [Fretibacter rubidus]|uniref:alpha/beta hydrolase family protein n=1 Tax=Fretibacter rubidus TaxID=570162 RepID=UPI00352B812E